MSKRRRGEPNWLTPSLDTAIWPKLSQFATYSQPPPKIECFLYCAFASTEDSCRIETKLLNLLIISDRKEVFNTIFAVGLAIV